MGGSSDRAANQARADEQARMQSISATQAAINRVFDGPGRQADIADAVAANRAYLTRDLDDQNAQAQRRLTFALARGGNLGGSLQLDQQGRLARDYNTGLLNVDRRARAIGSEIEANDQDARARLIQLATSGLDATTAAQQSAAALRTSLEAGRASSQANSLGDAFGTFSKFYQDSREAAQRRRGNQDAGFSLYGNSAFGYGGRP